MKYAFALLAIIAFSSSSIAQDYIKKIAKKTCKCSDSIDANQSAEAYQMEFGLCMMEAALPYEKQLAKDHNITFENMEQDGAKLGELVAMEMLVECPSVLLKMVETVGADTLEEEIEEEKQESKDSESSILQTIKGEVTAIDNDLFVGITVKDATGRSIKTIWLNYIESNVDIESDYKNLQGKSVEITFKMEDLFDSRLNEYSSKRIITKITVL